MDTLKKLKKRRAELKKKWLEFVGSRRHKNEIYKEMKTLDVMIEALS